MKPIMKLKSFAQYDTAAGVVAAMQTLFENPKRHLRGPYFSRSPGTGKVAQYGDDYTSPKVAISACASGARQLFAATSMSDAERERLYEALQRAAHELYPQRPHYILVSEGLGLKALRRVLARALKLLTS
jgi:hypothetical protein